MDQQLFENEQEAGAIPGRGPSRSAVVPVHHEWDDRGAEPPGWNVLGFLWRRKLRIAAIAMACMACMTLAIFIIVPTYRASSTVIFQGDAPGATRDDGQREPAFAADTLSNEIELLTSEELLAKVVVGLDLTDNPRFTVHSRLMPGRFAGAVDRARSWLMLRVGARAEPPEVSAAVTASARLSQAVDVLRSRLSIVPVGLSRVIRITAQAHDAELAATLANAVAVAYADTRARSKSEVTREAHDWIETRLNMLHDRALRSAQAYDAFRHANGAVRGKDGTFSQEQMSQIGTELTKSRAIRATLQATLAQAQSPGQAEADLDELATASTTALLPRLREQLAVATAREAEMMVRSGSKLPSLVATRAEIADINRSIAREVGRVRATVSAQLAVATSNEARLTDTLERLKAEVEAADAGGAQMRALQQDAAADDEGVSAVRQPGRADRPRVGLPAAERPHSVARGAAAEFGVAQQAADASGRVPTLGHHRHRCRPDGGTVPSRRARPAGSAPAEWAGAARHAAEAPPWRPQHGARMGRSRRPYSRADPVAQRRRQPRQHPGDVGTAA